MVKSSAKPSAKGTRLRLWLIIAFAALCVGFVGSGISGIVEGEDSNSLLDNPLYWVVQLLFVAGTIGAFVLSLLHLMRYSEKGMAVTFLVISSIFLLVIIISFLVGLVIGLTELFSETG